MLGTAEQVSLVFLVVALFLLISIWSVGTGANFNKPKHRRVKKVVTMEAF
tara:strand:+ start:3533 stop:3682 length:150 start_codon:yes stop_codon:yes gene_type:complete